MLTTPQKPCVVFVSSLSHRKCGIAKFTRDLLNSANSLFGEKVDFKRVVVFNGEEKNDPTPKNFIYKIDKNHKASYGRCAKFLNKNNQVKLISIQHEFGLFGGAYGNYILSFLKEIKKPVVLTLHTVIPKPDKAYFSLVKKMGARSEEIVAMTKRSKKILIKEYFLPQNKIKIIPHGIPSFHYEDNNQIKKNLGLEKELLVFTHGFLSRNKGIEYVIEALPGVIKRYPRLLYLLAGRTHPNVIIQEGESYRSFLLNKIKYLGIRKNVKFINRFITTRELVDYLKASDIYISTSLDPQQAVSGTFAYALGSGRPIISTAFAHSKEELKKCGGFLVKPRKPEEYGKALINLLNDKKLRKKVGMGCYFKTRNMIWDNVALSYGRLFARFVQGAEKVLVLPPIKLSHLFRMTDSFGLLQFAKFVKPLKRSGYTVDDNARALIICGEYYKKRRDEKILNYIKTYLNLLEYSFDRATGRFRNYINYDRSFNEKRNIRESYEDPTSRALYALSATAANPILPQKIRDKASNIFKASLNKPLKFTFNRSIANYLISLCYYLASSGKKEIEKEIALYADILCSRCEKRSSVDWIWFEDALTYSNGVIPEALFLAYRSTGRPKYLKVAVETTDFLLKHSFKKGVCIPIGQKFWFRKGKKRSYHDQQPEEVASLVQLLKTSYSITRKAEYKKLIAESYSWFLGNNTLKQVIYDFKTGGCYDGVGEKEVNLNQGAESTLSYLAARLAVSRKLFNLAGLK